MPLRFFMGLLLAAVFSSRPLFAADAAPIRATVMEQSIVCLRAGHMAADFAKVAQEAQPTNKVSGLVLDLRFADGDTNAAAGNFPAEKNIPLVILVNNQTRGAAAELAAKLRADHRAILVGGTNVTGSIAPDIAVAVNLDEEKKYLENPFAAPTEKKSAAANADLLPYVDHTSEAELVRRRVKDGDEAVADAPRSEPTQSVIRDPALARAVDLIKALAALHKPHPHG